MLQEEVHRYMQHMIAQVDSLQKSQFPGTQPITAVSFPTGQGAPASDFKFADPHVTTHLTLCNPTPVTRSPSQAQTLPPSQLISPLVNDGSNTWGGLFHFANLPNVVQKVLESLHVTDGLNVSELIKFVRALVRLRLMAPAFHMSTAYILQIVYAFTKGPVASKTLAAIHSGDTLDSYHEHVVTFFIPPRAMLPLLNAHY
jgi:hypothetical protein